LFASCRKKAVSALVVDSRYAKTVCVVARQSPPPSVVASLRMRGVYQHCKEKHLHRYLAEFDFRYNARVALGVNDTARTVKASLGARGKGLTSQDSSAWPKPQ